MEIVIIQGPSGSGKTFALRTLNPKSGRFITPTTKPLSWKGGDTNWKDAIIHLPDINQLAATITKLANQGAKWIVVEDFAHFQNNILLSDKFIAAGSSRDNKFLRYELFGKTIYSSVFELAYTVKSDTILYLLNHTMPDPDEGGKLSFKTFGKMVGNSVNPLSYSRITLQSVVVKAERQEDRYKFLTNSDDERVAKSPYGMFPAEYIPNDMGYVHKCIKAFVKGEDTPPLPYEATEPNNQQQSHE